MPIDLVTGDLLDASEDYIVHQCNCVTTFGKGLSKAIFSRYPHADIYRIRAGETSRPGTIDVRGTAGADHPRGVINLMGQVYPGRPRFPASRADGSAARERYFEQGLDLIARMHVRSLAFPHGIGCGLAGGDWDRYLAMIAEFAAQRSDIAVRIYRQTSR